VRKTNYFKGEEMYCTGDEALGRKSRDKMRQNSDGRRAVSEALSFANFTFHSRRHFRGYHRQPPQSLCFQLIYVISHRVMIKIFWIICNCCDRGSRFFFYLNPVKILDLSETVFFMKDLTQIEKKIATRDHRNCK